MALGEHLCGNQHNRSIEEADSSADNTPRGEVSAKEFASGLFMAGTGIQRIDKFCTARALPISGSCRM